MDFSINRIYGGNRCPYTFWIKHNNRYYHSNSVDINIDSKFDSEGEDIEISSDEEKIAYDEFKLIYKEIRNKLEDSGYAIIEYENSEEHIKDNIEANDLEFFADGSIY